MQIRHIRNANDIAVYLRLADRLDSPQSLAAFAAIEPFTARVASDPDLRTRLAGSTYVPEFAEIEALLMYLEHFSTLLITGNMNEDLILAEYANNINRMWDDLRETIYLRRSAGIHFRGIAFENLAMRARAYRDSGRMQRHDAKLLRDPRMRDANPALR